MIDIAGIDGCKAGWFVVSADTSLGTLSWFVADSIDGVARKLPHHTTIGIDIPIGIPDAGPRDCDQLARKLLSPPRGSSVFPAPVRPVLKCRDHGQASDVRERIDGKRMSVQAFNILRKIDEVDTYLRSAPDGSSRFYEVHPELAFAALNEGTPMAHPKRTAPGHAERAALLARNFGSPTIKAALSSYPRSEVARDDVLDAFAVLLSARRVVTGAVRRVPDNPVCDSAGLDMAIWF